jgi:predicted RNase H-like HicB family nuclease
VNDACSRAAGAGRQYVPAALIGRSRRPLNFTVRRHSDCAFARYNGSMRNAFAAINERDGKWFVAYCPEVPGANGQGRTRAAARKSLVAATALILKDRRADALRGLPRGRYSRDGDG